MKETPDWQTLIQRHLDGQTTDAEAAVLSEGIEQDAEVRSEYLMAARLHGALGDETLDLELETIAFPTPDPERKRSELRPLAWTQQIAAVLVVGALVGLLGAGVVWAIGTPTSEARLLHVSNGDFEGFVGPIDSGFPTQSGYWSGNPAEIIEEANGNRILRFLKTGNVMGNPNGGASNCSVFQLIDLTSLQGQRSADQSDSQLTLEISARFRREEAPTDADLPKLDASIRVYLFQGEPDFSSGNWPDVLREADAMGQQFVKLKPGDESAAISTSCILSSEATTALIAVSANTRVGRTAPVGLGGYFVDDVKLTAIKQPSLPVRFVK